MLANLHSENVDEEKKKIIWESVDGWKQLKCTGVWYGCILRRIGPSAGAMKMAWKFRIHKKGEEFFDRLQNGLAPRSKSIINWLVQSIYGT